jgi:VanZ family protein
MRRGFLPIQLPTQSAKAPIEALLAKRQGSYVRVQSVSRLQAGSMRRLFQIVAWFLLVAIVVLSVVPPEDRPVTPAPHDFEHVAIFVATGLAFGLGYAGRYLVQILGLIAFSAAIEIIQLGIPGRHARVSDFIVDALSVSIGVGLAFLLAEHKAFAGFRR